MNKSVCSDLFAHPRGMAHYYDDGELDDRGLPHTGMGAMAGGAPPPPEAEPDQPGAAEEKEGDRRSWCLRFLSIQSTMQPFPAVQPGAIPIDMEGNDILKPIEYFGYKHRERYLRWMEKANAHDTDTWVAWLNRCWNAVKGTETDRIADDIIISNLSDAMRNNYRQAKARRSYRRETNLTFAPLHFNMKHETVTLSHVLYVLKEHIPNDDVSNAQFTGRCNQMEHAVRRLASLVQYFLDAGMRERHRAQRSERYTITILRAGRVSELIREICALPWPAAPRHEEEKNTDWVNDVFRLMDQIIDLCPERREVAVERVPDEAKHNLWLPSQATPEQIGLGAPLFPDSMWDMSEPNERWRIEVAHRYVESYCRSLSLGEQITPDTFRGDMTDDGSEYRWWIIGQRIDSFMSIVLHFWKVYLAQGRVHSAETRNYAYVAERQLISCIEDSVDIEFPITSADKLRAKIAEVPRVTQALGWAAWLISHHMGVQEQAIAATNAGCNMDLMKVATARVLDKDVAAGIQAHLNDGLAREVAEKKLGPFHEFAFELLPPTYEHAPTASGTAYDAYVSAYGNPVRQLGADGTLTSTNDFLVPYRTTSYREEFRRRELRMTVYALVKMDLTKHATDTGSSVMRYDYRSAFFSDLNSTQGVRKPVEIRAESLHVENTTSAIEACSTLTAAVVRAQQALDALVAPTAADRATQTAALDAARADLLTCTEKLCPGADRAACGIWCQVASWVEMGFAPGAALLGVFFRYMSSSGARYENIAKLINSAANMMSVGAPGFYTLVLVYNVYARGWIRRAVYWTGKASFVTLFRLLSKAFSLLKYILGISATVTFGTTNIGIGPKEFAAFLTSDSSITHTMAYLAGWNQLGVPAKLMNRLHAMTACMMAPPAYLSPGATFGECVDSVMRDADFATTASAVSLTDTVGRHTAMQFMYQMAEVTRGRKVVSAEELEKIVMAMRTTNDSPNIAHTVKIIRALSDKMGVRITGDLLSEQLEFRAASRAVCTTMARATLLGAPARVMRGIMSTLGSVVQWARGGQSGAAVANAAQLAELPLDPGFLLSMAVKSVDGVRLELSDHPPVAERAGMRSAAAHSATLFLRQWHQAAGMLAKHSTYLRVEDDDKTVKLSQLTETVDRTSAAARRAAERDRTFVVQPVPVQTAVRARNYGQREREPPAPVRVRAAPPPPLEGTRRRRTAAPVPVRQVIDTRRRTGEGSDSSEGTEVDVDTSPGLSSTTPRDHRRR